MTLKEMEEAIVKDIESRWKKISLNEIMDFNEDTLICDCAHNFFGHWIGIDNIRFCIYYSDAEPEFVAITINEDDEEIGCYKPLVENIDAIGDVYTNDDLNKAMAIARELFDALMCGAID